MWAPAAAAHRRLAPLGRSLAWVARSPMDFELEFLGTSSSMPSMRRNTSCVAFKHPKFSWLFDCGEGTQRQRLYSTVALEKIDRVFITHMHGDHVLGLPGMIMGIDHLRRSRGIDAPLPIYGPVGLHDFLAQTFFRMRSMPKLEVYEMSTMDTASDNPRLKRHERLLGPADRITCEGVSCYRLVSAAQGGLEVLAVPIAHTVDCFGYVIREPDKPARVDITRAISKGVMLGPAISVLRRGFPVITRDGVQVMPEEVIEPVKKGRKIVILGDTNDPSSLAPIAHASDVLVHECTFAGSQETIARARGHSSSTMAGAFARAIEARTLILTHFSPRFGRVAVRPMPSGTSIVTSAGYESDEDTFEEQQYADDDQVRTLLQEARQTFRSDAIFAAEDFDRFVIPAPIAGRPRQPCYRVRTDDMEDF